MNPNENLYWWCNSCKINVDILQAPGVGIFCIQCGSSVSMPKNIPEPLFFDDEEESEWPDEEEDIEDVL